MSYPIDLGPTDDDFLNWNEHNDHADDYEPDGDFERGMTGVIRLDDHGELIFEADGE